MQLYVKLWKARRDWLALSRQERSEFLARCSAAFAAASGESELIGFGLHESDPERSGEYRYMAVWRIHAGSAAARLDAALERLEWNRYFDGVDSLATAVTSDGLLNYMATTDRAATPEPEQRGFGALVSKLARGLGIVTAAEPARQNTPAQPVVAQSIEPSPPVVLTPRPEPVTVAPPQPVVSVPKMPPPLSVPVVPAPEPVPALVSFIEEDVPFEVIEPIEQVEVSEPRIVFESARLVSARPPATGSSTGGDGIDIDLYLERIGYTGSREPTAETLRELHRAHLRTVPFENLDILSGHSIVLDQKLFYQKIIAGRRGGICYELNGLFAMLLRALGFNVTLLSANVTREEGRHGPDFDHIALMVRLEERWLVDVGFGDSFSEPLMIDEVGEQYLPEATYRIYNDAGLRSLLRRSAEMKWSEQYIFTLLPRELVDFAEMCDFHQTSPQSSFTYKRICSRMTADGRVSLSDTHLILSSGGKRRELRLANATEYRTMLQEYFGIFTGE